MAKRLDGMVIFSTEQYGFNKDQVSQYLLEIHVQYEKLFQENRRLKEKIKKKKQRDSGEADRKF